MILATLFVGKCTRSRLSVLSAYFLNHGQVLFLKHQKKDYRGKNIFMTNLHEGKVKERKHEDQRR